MIGIGISVHVHVHVHHTDPAPVPPATAAAPFDCGSATAGYKERATAPGSPRAEAIGDGALLKLIAEYGPKLLALLIQLGFIKLPAGVTFPGPSATP